MKNNQLEPRAKIGDMVIDNHSNSGELCTKGDYSDWNKLCDRLHREGRRHTRTIPITCPNCQHLTNHRVYDDNMLLWFCCGHIHFRPIIVNA